MTALADPPHTAPDVADASDLQRFGYRPQLQRSIGTYGSFAAGFSFVSILTTVFQLFSFGFGFGGPAFFWTWPLVFGGQLLVALCFAELAAKLPISGCIYQWSTRLGGALWGWTAGWLMLVAQVVTVAAAAIAMQVVLPSIWDGFQLVADPTANAVLLGSALLIATTLINAVGVRTMSVINSVGVTCELAGVVLLCVALFGHAERGPGVVLHPGPGAGHGTTYLWSFAISGLMAAYVLVGFDSAGELSEETKSPRRTAPRTILRALVVSGIGGALMLLATLMAAPSVTDGALGDPARGLPYVLTSRLGGTLGRVFLVDVAIAVTVCTLAIQTATTRMMFSMARDRVLPFSTALSRVNPRTRTPILPAVVVGVLAVGLLVLNVGNAAVFLALSSVCIMLLYLAYLMVTAPLLLARLRGRWSRTHGLFCLGRWGLPVNAVAVVWGIGMAVNLAWPRAKVFGADWYLRFFPELVLAGAVGVGAVAYATRRSEVRGGAAGRQGAPFGALAVEVTE
ncbi:amino acid permease [Planosporangium thailandense]|uniref:Amino acid permease n=1 Tax=Planosporangium thailandense TaxID=765197 RepID=A0ABX0Y1K5_9ACTN|nr:amino acid permease [Planosporangium thailandense]NJC72240.1 amino acid permease [Planosporangium thailandense]